jgi:diguanylate cyclase (GGDEF)-like protein
LSKITWTYSYPLIVLFLFGRKTGTWIIIFVYIISFFILTIPDLPLKTANYAFAFVMRYYISNLVVFVIALFYEYIRSKLHEQSLEANRKYEEASKTDFLTAVLNRRGVEYILNQDNYPQLGKDYTLFLIDIDFFKQVNDTYGHDCGDAILKEVAQVLKNSLRGNDLISRWGGEEFLVIVYEINRDQAWQIGDKLRKRIEEHQFVYADKPQSLTISIGIKLYEPDLDFDALIIQADANLYQAKHDGRNRCAIS